MFGKVDARIAELNKMKDAAAKARLPFDREAWLNLAFYLNHQYVQWDEGSNAIRAIPKSTATKDAPRPIVNKIMHYVQQERSMVLQAKPVPDVLPATDDMMDISDAAVGKAYLGYLAEPTMNNFPKQLSRAVLWALICGDGWLKWPYDTHDKRPGCIPCSFFEVFVDPYAKDFDRARYVIHSQFLDVEQVYEAWGVRVPPREVQEADIERTAMMRGMGSAPVLSGVEVHELWAKPCRDHPRGRYAVWTEKQFLVPPQDHPYDHRKLPFTQIGCLERPDSLHYMSPVEYLRSSQMALNKFHAQKISAREAFANPKWWIDDEIELAQPINDSYRQVLTGTGGVSGRKPEILQPAAMLDNGDGAMIEEQMMHIVGLHEVSGGQVPGRVEAAKAIEMLKESDADRLSTMLDTIAAAISVGGYQQLQLAKQFVKETVLVQTYSREGLPEVQHFKASNMKDGMRVQVTMGTGLARSRAARQDQLMNMWQQGIIRDPQLMAELMEVPFPSFAEPRARDLRLARNENMVMAKGESITPNSWDDHAIHLREHNDYRKSQEFLTLSEDSKIKFEYHCTHHETFEEAVLGRQAKLALIMQGASPTAPAAPADMAGGEEPVDPAAPPEAAPAA